jgi:hypothetical protein
MAPNRSNRKHGADRGARVDRFLRDNLFEDEQVVMVARPGRLATLPKYVVTLGL